jgi:transcriptional regulator with XRE-family HTH domain
MPAERRARSPTAVDVTVGRNVRFWRMARGLSQAQLAKRLGVAFQQVQKYESGADRIAAGRLVKVAAVLGVPMSALFAGADGAEPWRSFFALVSDARSFRLAHAFAAIRNKTLRLAIVALVEKVAVAVPRPKRRRKPERE